jgi:hypothetical protein
VGPRACGCLHLLQPSTLTLTMTASLAGGLTLSTPQLLSSACLKSGEFTLCDLFFNAKSSCHYEASSRLCSSVSASCYTTVGTPD